VTDYPLVLEGNSYSFAIAFTGEVGELRYDSSNWDLLLHDGATVGGRRFLSMANSDQRYQAKSVELSGLTGFEPQQKGFLVRLGPSTYRIRTWQVDGANLVITNANGYAGNPLIGLKPTISSDHTFAGDVTFQQPIQADGGVIGDVTGNTAGTHTGNVVGNTTGTHTGSVDARGADFFVDDGAIHLAALNDDVGEYILGRGVPYGGIIMWTGSIAAIPSYWFLCDGTNGTPDLRDRFILGAGGVYAPHNTGGSDLITADLDIDALTSHSHTFEDDGHTLIEAEIPAHKHGSGAVDRNPTGGTWHPYGVHTLATPTAESIKERSEPGQGESWTSTVGGGTAHSHSGTTDAGGGVTPTGTVTFDPKPQFFALAYIMKGV